MGQIPRSTERILVDMYFQLLLFVESCPWDFLYYWLKRFVKWFFSVISKNVLLIALQGELETAVFQPLTFTFWRILGLLLSILYNVLHTWCQHGIFLAKNCRAVGADGCEDTRLQVVGQVVSWLVIMIMLCFVVLSGDATEIKLRDLKPDAVYFVKYVNWIIVGESLFFTFELTALTCL